MSASYDNSIKLYHEDDDDWACFDTLHGHDSTVWSLSFDGAGQRFASCSDDRTVRIWQEFPRDGAYKNMLDSDLSQGVLRCSLCVDQDKCKWEN